MLTKGSPSPHDAILSVQSTDRAALRMGDWKLMMTPSTRNEAKRTEGTANTKGKRKKNAEPNVGPRDVPTSKSYALYNLAADISESNNLVDKEVERANVMRAKLDELLKDAVPPGDKL
jgi:hypothetical protein